MCTCRSISVVLFPQSCWPQIHSWWQVFKVGKWFCHRSVKGHMKDIFWVWRLEIESFQRDSRQFLESVQEKLISFIHTPVLTFDSWWLTSRCLRHADCHRKCSLQRVGGSVLMWALTSDRQLSSENNSAAPRGGCSFLVNIEQVPDAQSWKSLHRKCQPVFQTLSRVSLDDPSLLLPLRRGCFIWCWSERVFKNTAHHLAKRLLNGTETGPLLMADYQNTTRLFYVLEKVLLTLPKL